MRANSIAGNDYDLRKSVPAGIELSWPSTAEVGFCYVCSKLNTSPTLLRPCDHLICQSCARCAASNALCPLCRVGVTGSDCDHTRIRKLRELAIATCECKWQGSVDAAVVHKCQGRQYVTHILWDLDNIQPPHGQLVDWYIAVAQTLERLDFANRYTIKGALYFRSGTPASEVKLAAEKLRLQLRPASLKPEATDRLIASDIQLIVEASKHAPLKPKVVLISSDMDCIPDVRACEIAEIPTCVIHNAEPNSQHEKLLQYQPSLAMRIQDIVQEHHESIRAPTEPRPTPGAKKPEPVPQALAAPAAAPPSPPTPLAAAKSPAAAGRSPDERFEPTPLTPSTGSTGRSSISEEAAEKLVSDLSHYELPPSSVVPIPTAGAVEEVEAPRSAAPLISTPQKHSESKIQQPPAKKTATPKASRDVTAPAPKATPHPKPFFGDGLVEIDGKPIVAMDLMRNEGFHAVQNGERSPHLCNLKVPHDARLCTLLHYNETKPKTPTAPAPKSWGGVASTPPPKPPAPAPAHTISKPLAPPPKAERLFSVDGELVPESKLIRNAAVEYLENNPHAKGRCCTNHRVHEAKACTFVHYKKQGKK